MPPLENASDAPARASMSERYRAFHESAVTPRLQIMQMIPIAGRGLVALLTVLYLILGLLPVVFVVATSVVIGRVPAATEAGLDSPEWSGLLTAFLIAAGAFLLTQVLAPICTAIGARLRRTVDFWIRDQVLELTERTVSIGPLEDAAVLDELAEATRNLDSDYHTAGSAVGGLVALVARYTSLVGYCALLGWATYWWAGVAMFCVTMMFRYANRGGLRKYSGVWRLVRSHSRSADYLRDLGMGEAVAKEARVFGLSGWLSQRYQETYWTMYGPVISERRRIYFYPYLWYTAIGVAVVTWLAFAMGEGAIRGQVELTFLALGLQAILAAVGLGHQYPESDVATQFGMRMLTSLEHLRTLIEAAAGREDKVLASRPRESGQAPSDVDVASLPQRELTFDNVHFRYPGSDATVLDGLDLTLPVGQSTAIVGVNGAGKTTLVKLLTRLYEPTQGHIRADGMAIDDFDIAAWRRQVSVIFQDFVRYELSIADNVAWGASHAARDQDAIAAALRDAGLEEVFADLPRGLETPLARAYPDGIDLSGGQWQRVAIARSLYALSQGAQVLILDEPTAALDVRAEAAFFDQFVGLTQGVTSVLISHRFSSVRRADHIVVIDGGRIAERGSHAELMAAGGHYARLFSLQAERFARGLDAEGDLVDTDEEDAEVSAP